MAVEIVARLAKAVHALCSQGRRHEQLNRDIHEIRAMANLDDEPPFALDLLIFLVTESASIEASEFAIAEVLESAGFRIEGLDGTAETETTVLVRRWLVARPSQLSIAHYHESIPIPLAYESLAGEEVIGAEPLDAGIGVANRVCSKGSASPQRRPPLSRRRFIGAGVVAPRPLRMPPTGTFCTKYSSRTPRQTGSGSTIPGSPTSRRRASGPIRRPSAGAARCCAWARNCAKLDLGCGARAAPARFARWQIERKRSARGIANSVHPVSDELVSLAAKTCPT